MFIGTEQNSIKRFFQDIGFIPPAGMALDYFILPPDSDVNTAAPPDEYPSNLVNTDPKRGTTVVYQPKDVSKVRADPKNGPDPLMHPAPMPFTPNKSPDFGLVGPDGQTKRVMSKELKNRVAVVESTRDHFDMRLNESTDRFPKGTFFHFRREA